MNLSEARCHLTIGRDRIAEALGDRALVNCKMLGFVCSQKAPGDVVLKTYDFARMVRCSVRTIVSGFHSLIEKDCLAILLRGSTPIIVVQGRRLTTNRLSAEWQNAIAAGRLLLISPFSGKQKRVTIKLAEERNRVMAALANEVLVAYSHPGGKTEKLARELLASGRRVYTFSSKANEALVGLGAVPIEPDYFANKAESMSG